jgi:crotonobetainyl-CoA:carnitine CoA-transferase CaiB-like acyl-CoA transferase
VIAVFDEGEWEALRRVMGDPSWTKEEKFSSLLKRKKNSKELDELIEQWTAPRTPEEIVQILQEAGVSAGVVQNGQDLANDPHLMAREFFIPLEHPALGRTISDSTPIRFKDNPKVDWKAAPLLGEDNRYVYMELLGFSEEEFSSYVEKGIIG